MLLLGDNGRYLFRFFSYYKYIPFYSESPKRLSLLGGKLKVVFPLKSKIKRLYGVTIIKKAHIKLRSSMFEA